MKEHIEREATIKRVTSAMIDCLDMESQIRTFDVVKAIGATPTADVVPWEWLEQYADYFCARVSIPEFVRKAKMVFYKEMNGGANNERK